MARPTVFLSSASDTSEGYALAHALKEQLETTAEVTVWQDDSTSYPGKSSAESLMEIADRSDFAVFILTPDYMAYPGPPSETFTRSNVLFELGLFAGRLGPSRTFVIGDAERAHLSTNLAGIIYIPILARRDSNIPAAIAPVAAAIRRTMADIHPRQERVQVEFYSSFISYSWRDQDFALRLHDDLQDVGVRSWLDAKEIKHGDPLMERIDKAIQAHDKVLLILSEASIKSTWVKLEVQNAFRLERERKKTVLFPIRLDNAVFEVSGAQEFDQLRERDIVNFSHWKDKRLYRRAFSQLVRDLTISAAVESGGH